MHKEALDFLRAVRAELPELSGKRIVELGSKDVNGSPRSIFAGAHEYVGVDICPGHGVDVVMDCRKFDGENSFDICICVESMEHDPNPRAFIDAAWRSLRAGGLFVVTAAAPPRMPHSCDGQLGGHEYYTNIFPEHLRYMLVEWQKVKVYYNPEHGDVYAVAYRPPGGGTTLS
jgi:SAM-dependent methyltransferase